MNIDRIAGRAWILPILVLWVTLGICLMADAVDGQTTYSTQVIDVTQTTVTSTTTTTVYDGGQRVYLPKTQVFGSPSIPKKKWICRRCIITVGSGPEFDYASIQDALDNAPLKATIRVAAGTYEESIVIQNEVRLLGVQHKTDPAGSTSRGPESEIIGDVIVAADGATVSGFKLDGYQIIIAGAQHVTVGYNILLGSTGWGAIHIGNTASGFSGPSHHAHILRNALFGAETYGIFNVANDGVIIRHNHIENTRRSNKAAGNAIDCANHAGTGIWIFNNTVVAPEGKGINYWAGPGVRVEGNHISKAGDEAVFTDTVAHIKNNTIDGSDKLGIGLLTQNTRKSSVWNNMVLNCQLDGIWIEGDRTRVTRNEISGITYAAVNVRFGTEKVSIRDNDVSFSSTGVESYGKANIQKNIIDQCTRGVSFYTNDSAGSRVINNKISHIDFDGIWIDAEDVNVSRNRIRDVVYAAINIRSGADKALIGNNTLSSNGSGVDVLGSSTTGNRVVRNELDQNDWGIRLFGADQNLIYKNKIDDSAQVGILLDTASSGNRIIRNRIKASGVCDIDDQGFDNVWKHNHYETACHLTAGNDSEEGIEEEPEEEDEEAEGTEEDEGDEEEKKSDD